MGEKTRIAPPPAGESGQPTAGERSSAHCDGVLVGWAHNEFSGRIGLRLQTARSARSGSPDDVHQHHLIMTRNQATLLAQYLLGVTGQEAMKPRKRRWWSRLFPG